MSFSLKLGRMKKAEEFVTYPIQRNDSGDIIRLQSGHRWAEMNAKTGEIELSARRAQYANSMWLMICKINGTAEKDQATPEQLETMRSAIIGTAGPMVGNNILHMYCDNSNAGRI